MTPKFVYMVFEYCEYDLMGILDTSEIFITIDHVKAWSQQVCLPKFVVCLWPNITILLNSTCCFHQITNKNKTNHR